MKKTILPHWLFWLQLSSYLYFTGCSIQSTPIENTFRLAWESEPRTTDPRYAIDANSQYLNDFLHCSLIRFNDQGDWVPHLASQLKWIDSKTLEITLHSTFRFSNHHSRH